MIGVYFSGTGNTRHCVEKFVEHFNGSTISIESSDVVEAIRSTDDIAFGYPIHFSNAPKIVQDFIAQNRAEFTGKRVFIICTMALFSGDGAGCAARLLKKCGAEIIGGLHLITPDNVGDFKALKKSLEKNHQQIKAAELKIAQTATALKKGRPPHDGLSPLHHAAGFLGQRLWFASRTRTYTDRLKIDEKACIGCMKCVELCPMQSISTAGNKARSGDMCTMCYRCVNNCPERAITLLGKKVVEPCLVERYLNVES
jgi:ferredoxin/flavodoxin